MLLNEFINPRDTNYAIRRRRIETALEELKEKNMDANKARLNEGINEIISKSSKLAKNFGTNPKNRENKKNLQEQLQKNYINVKKILIESMCNIVYKSLVLDDSFKKKFKGSIINTSENFFNESFNKGLLDLKSFKDCDSITVKDMYRIAESYSQLLSVSEGELAHDILFEEASKETSKSEDKVAEIVKKKVTETIANEKEIAKRNKEQLEEAVEMGYVVVKKEKPSLFKSIVIGNSRQPINENGNSSNEIKMDMIFAESSIQYALLETLNTMRLLNLSAAQANRLAFDFAFIESTSKK